MPWIAMVVLAAAVFCLLPLARNRGWYLMDELLLRDALQSGATVWDWSSFGRGDGLFYRPLGFGLLMLQLDLAGTPPAVHWLSLLHHAGNALLFALLLRRLGLPPLVAGGVLLSAAAVEGVAWAAAMYDRSAVTCCLLSAIAVTSRGASALLALPAFALALCCKETAVTLPPIALLVVLGCRAAPGARWRRGVLVALTAMALAFAMFRLAYAAPAPEYSMHLQGGEPLRLLRYLAFPFALGAQGPPTLWGTRWIPALTGLAVWIAAALGRPRLLVASVVAIAAPLVPVMALPHVQANYLYPATPGFALLFWAAWSGAAALPARLGVVARIAVLAVVAMCCWHTRAVAAGYERWGRALHNLAAQYRDLPPSPSPVVVSCPDPFLRNLTDILAAHVGRRGERPALESVDAAAAEAADAALAFTVDGTLVRR
ncbi:MAG: hypothetical protein AB7O97_16045 [Planctomycetota bacterium]